MMKNLFKPDSLFLFFIAPMLFFACSSDDDGMPTPRDEGAYSSGVFIINEGNFGSDNSSISFYYPEKDSVVNNIFLKRNDRKLGNTTQSMFINDSLAYIIVNVSNKLEVVSHSSFQSKGGIDEGLANPRYFTSLADKGYITNWGTFDPNTFAQVDPPFIAIVDLNDLSISDTIRTGNGPENILALNDKIFFTNNFGNTLGVLDPATLEVNEITLASSPSAMVEDANGDLWVIAGGEYGENNGKLLRVDPATEAIEASIELGLSPAGKLVINDAKDKLYYYAGRAVYELAINASSAPASPLIENDEAQGFYGIGYDPAGDIIYIGDDNGFQGSGTVYRYSLDGTLLNSFETGVGPNSFLFK